MHEGFKPLITALDAVGDENVSYEKVKNRKKEKENDIDHSSDAKGSDDAFAASRVWNKKGKHNGNCHNFQERGHYARDCPKRNADSANRK